MFRENKIKMREIRTMAQLGSNKLPLYISYPTRLNVGAPCVSGSWFQWNSAALHPTNIQRKKIEKTLVLPSYTPGSNELPLYLQRRKAWNVGAHHVLLGLIWH
jgi:hypothetical protein